MVILVHPEISYILDAQLRPESLYRTRRGSGRPARNGVTTNSSALADALEDEEPISGGEGEIGCGLYEEIPSVTVPSMVTVPSINGLILPNGAEPVR